MQVRNVLRAARWKYRTQKIAIWAPSHNFVGLYLGTHRQSEENLLSSNISPRCPHRKTNFGPLTPEIGSGVWAPLQISTGFASWQRYCTALQEWESAKLCGVEQKAPPIFDRAAITLGIGPHSSIVKRHYKQYTVNNNNHNNNNNNIKIIIIIIIIIIILK